MEYLKRYRLMSPEQIQKLLSKTFLNTKITNLKERIKEIQIIFDKLKMKRKRLYEMENMGPDKIDENIPLEARKTGEGGLHDLSTIDKKIDEMRVKRTEMKLTLIMMEDKLESMELNLV